jgi:hypothetical protein
MEFVLHIKPKNTKTTQNQTDNNAKQLTYAS